MTSLRIAVVADIHGNRTAFDAVLADLKETAPDLILHGGDLADSGSGPVEIVDRIRDLGWEGVVGNTDQMLFAPELLADFAKRSPQLQSLFVVIEAMAAATRAALGEERLEWLRSLPLARYHGPMALVHASPESPWRAPVTEASDAELEGVYGSLARPIAVYGHIHRAIIRKLPGLTVANTGSVGLSYDGDCRASYLLLDDSEPAIRRVEYDVDRESQALAISGFPHAGWVAKMLHSGCFEMP